MENSRKLTREQAMRMYVEAAAGEHIHGEGKIDPCFAPTVRGRLWDGLFHGPCIGEYDHDPCKLCRVRFTVGVRVQNALGLHPGRWATKLICPDRPDLPPHLVRVARRILTAPDSWWAPCDRPHDPR